jgi:plastocyanin
MKLDLTKLPVWEGIAGFLILILAVTFYFAFQATDDDGGGGDPGVSETPLPVVTPVDGRVQVSMRDNFFEPDAIGVAAGEAVTFDITNDGGAIHNMHIAGPDGDYDTDEDGAISDPELVSGGDAATLTWEATAEAGEIDFRCDFHPDVMTGTITVQ